MKSKKSIGKRIVEWFSDNTWIYGATITIAICGVLAFVSISLGKEKGNGNNMFVGGIELEWSFDEEEQSKSNDYYEESNESLENSKENSSEGNSSVSGNANANCVHKWQCVENTFATCEKEGVIIYECQNCGGFDKIIRPALGHEYAGGCCVRCGRSE